jgi:hypothetical protein
VSVQTTLTKTSASVRPVVVCHVCQTGLVVNSPSVHHFDDHTTLNTTKTTWQLLLLLTRQPNTHPVSMTPMMTFSPAPL